MVLSRRIARSARWVQVYLGQRFRRRASSAGVQGTFLPLPAGKVRRWYCRTLRQWAAEPVTCYLFRRLNRKRGLLRPKRRRPRPRVGMPSSYQIGRAAGRGREEEQVGGGAAKK